MLSFYHTSIRLVEKAEFIQATRNIIRSRKGTDLCFQGDERLALKDFPMNGDYDQLFVMKPSIPHLASGTEFMRRD